MVTRYDNMSSKWSSHFWVKMHVFSTSFNNKSDACWWNDAKCSFICYFTWLVKHKKLPFIAVLTWFLILGKIQDGSQGGDHCQWRHRPPAAPPPIKHASPCWDDQSFSTEGKTVSKYCNTSKVIGRGSINLPPPPSTTVGHEFACASDG